MAIDTTDQNPTVQPLPSPALQSGLDQLGANQPAAPTAPITAPVAPAAPAPPASGFAQRFGASQKAILSDPQTADIAMNKPGGWARSVLLSATAALSPSSRAGRTIQDGLSGLQDASTGTPGSGWISAVTGTMKNRADRIANQNQRQFDNDLKTKESQRQDQMLSLEQQRTKAQMAASQAEEVLHAKMSRNADLEYQTNSTKDAQADAQPLFDAGALTTATKQTSDQLQEVLKADAAKGIQDHYFQDGWQPQLDAQGKPMTDKDGTQQMRATWMIVGPVPNNGMVNIDAAKAADWNKLGVTPTPLKAGQQLPAADYYRLSKDAQTQRGVQQSVDNVKSEIAERSSAAARDQALTREANLTIEEKEQNNRTRLAFAPYLAAANGDDNLAMDSLSRSTDPKVRALIGPVEQLYGPGSLETMRVKKIDGLQQTIKGNNDRLDKIAKENGDTDFQQIVADNTAQLSSGKDSKGKGLTDAQKGVLQADLDSAQKHLDEINGIKSDTKQAQQQQDQYLGIHPSDSPEMQQIQNNMLDADPDPEKRASIILNSTTLDDARKLSLLQRDGLTTSQLGQQWLKKPETQQNLRVPIKVVPAATQAAQPNLDASIKLLDQVPNTQRAAKILGATAMPNPTKAQLLQHYGLPVPPALLPSPQQQPRQ